MSSRQNPLVSIIITTKNEEDVIGVLLKSIKLQSYKNIETLVIDNNSGDKTVEICEKKGVRVHNFGPERSAQRNYGAERAKGDYLLFLDADMELNSMVVWECVDNILGKKNIGALVIPEESIAYSFWGKVKAFERSFYNMEGDPVTDAARFFPKKVFQEAGEYDEDITGPEDWDLPETVRGLGYKVRRVNAKIKHYERIDNLLDLARKKYYYALKSNRYLRKHKISLISQKTVYFLRPVFYRNWRKMLRHPFMSLLMFLMFAIELMGGGTGYLVGKLKNE